MLLKSPLILMKAPQILSQVSHSPNNKPTVDIIGCQWHRNTHNLPNNDLRLRAYRYYATPLLLLPPKSTSSQHANCSRTLFRTYSNDASAVYTQTVRPESVSTHLDTSRQGPATELLPSAKSVYFLIIKWAKARDPVVEAVEEQEAKLVPPKMM